MDQDHIFPHMMMSAPYKTIHEAGHTIQRCTCIPVHMCIVRGVGCDERGGCGDGMGRGGGGGGFRNYITRNSIEEGGSKSVFRGRLNGGADPPGIDHP